MHLAPTQPAPRDACLRHPLGIGSSLPKLPKAPRTTPLPLMKERVETSSTCPEPIESRGTARRQPLGVFRASSGSRNACFAFTARSTSAFPPQAQLHVIDASTGGSAVRLLVRPSTRQHVWALLAGPDGMCDGGIGTTDTPSLRCHSQGWPSVRVVLRPAGKARRGHQLAHWTGSKEGIRTTHHHFIIGSFSLTSGDEICRWLRAGGGARARKKKDGSSTKKPLQDRGRPPF